MTAVAGSVYIELQVSGRWAISLLTEGWADAEKQAVLDGDRDAMDAFYTEAERRTLARPNDCAIVVCEARLSSGVKETSA